MKRAVLLAMVFAAVVLPRGLYECWARPEHIGQVLALSLLNGACAFVLLFGAMEWRRFL